MAEEGAHAEAVAKAAGHAAVSSAVEVVDLLFDYLVPVIALVVGLLVGPLIFTGEAIGNALWDAGLNDSAGAIDFGIGLSLGALIVSLGGFALWRMQKGKSGVAKWIPRTASSFVFGWAAGILVMLVTRESTQQTGGDSTTQGYLDAAIMGLAQDMGADGKVTANQLEGPNGYVA